MTGLDKKISFNITCHLILQGQWHFNYIIQAMMFLSEKEGTYLDYSLIK